MRRFRKIAIQVLATLLFISHSHSAFAQQAPTKQSLIAALRTILPLLEAGKWEEAAQHVVMPDGLEPRDLASIARNNELSADGISALESSAEFGLATELFGASRAEALCKKMGIGTENVYGFNHQQGDQWGEVLAQWDGKQFRFVRLDDVGKLAAESKPDSGKMRPGSEPKADTGKSTAKSPDIMSLSSKEALALLPETSQAAEANPDDLGALLRYAMVLFKVKNYPEAWKQLRSARKIAPRNLGVARGTDALMNAFTTLGIFTVGVPKETVKAILGEPTENVELGDERDRWVYGHWGVDFKQGRVHEIINLLGATEALFRPTETIGVDLDGRPWRTQLRRKQKGRATAFLLLAGETVSEFTEQITIERYLGASALGTIKEIAEKTVADEVAATPGAQVRVLEIEDSSAYLISEAPVDEDASDGSKAYRLIRLIRADKDLHRLQYLVKSSTPPDQETQRKWLGIFKAAKLEPVNAR